MDGGGGADCKTTRSTYTICHPRGDLKSAMDNVIGLYRGSFTLGLRNIMSLTFVSSFLPFKYHVILLYFTKGPFTPKVKD